MISHFRTQFGSAPQVSWWAGCQLQAALQFLSMQKYVYSFQSSVGIFWIRPERDKSWGLYIGGEGLVELLGCYDSAFTAADSVYMQTTGWDGWDRCKRIDAPPTLLLWSKKPVK